MKAVLDTNVLISGMLSPEGICRRLLMSFRKKGFILCIDDRILNEYERVVYRSKFGIPRPLIEELFESIRLLAERVIADPVAIPLPDPSDLPFLEVAVEAEAVLVTGNKRHFPARICRGVPIVSPREMLDLLSRRLSS